MHRGIVTIAGDAITFCQRDTVLRYRTGVDGIHVGVDGQINDFTGFQIGAINFVEKKSRAAQVAVFLNQASEMIGVQIGVVNVADTLKGVQFGLINVNAGGWLPFVPILNIGW